MTHISPSSSSISSSSSALIRNALALTAGLVLSALASCALPADAPLTFEEFVAEHVTPRAPGSGEYLIGEDLILRGEDELYEAYEEFLVRYEAGLAQDEHGHGDHGHDEIGSSQQALVIKNRSSGGYRVWNDKMNITFCVDAAFGLRFPIVLGNMFAATADWEEALQNNVRFVYVHHNQASCYEGATDLITGETIDIAVIPDFTNSSSSCARATYPSSSGSYIEIDVDNMGLDGSIDCAGTWRGYLRHEVGHTLGFMHEFSVDANGDKQCQVQNTGGTQLSPFDPFSSMTYPSCSGLGDYFISPYDAAYGLCAYSDDPPPFCP